MCGRFTLTTPLTRLEARFGFDGRNLAFLPRYNVAPTQEVLAVAGDGAERRVGYLRWGLVPSWAKSPAIGSRMINARAETLSEKPAFRKYFRERRCLILADGFYEWKREGARKTPLRFTLRDREPFSFAGLWGSWQSSEGEQVRSCTIITTAANDLVAPVHDRMPVILSPEAESMWLQRDADTGMLRSLLKPFPAGSMTAYPVSSRVNAPGNDDPACILPV